MLFRSEYDVVRLFEGRKLVGQIEVDEIARECWEETLPEFLSNESDGTIRKSPASLDEVVEFLNTEPTDEDDGEDDGEEGFSGSVVPDSYREIYGSDQNCGDDVAVVLTNYVTEGHRHNKNPDGGLDRVRLREVAIENGIGDKLNGWEYRGLNGGLLRMNTSNVLRGMIRRGERVQIGLNVWHSDPSKIEARKEARRQARRDARDRARALADA